MLKHSKKLSRTKSLRKIPRKASNKINKCSPKKRSKKASRKASRKVKKCSPKKRSRKASRKTYKKVKNCSKNKKSNSGKLKRSRMNWGGWNLRKIFNAKKYKLEKEKEQEEKNLDIKFFDLKSTFENCNFCINKDSKQPINPNEQKNFDKRVFSKTNNTLTFTLTKKGLTEEKFIIKIKINGGEEYIFTSTLIGKGSFGKIYKLYNKKFKVEFGLKIEEEPTEKNISEFLDDKSCNLLKVKYIGYESSLGQHFYLMELADGNLNSLADKFHACNIKKKYDLSLSRTFFRDVAEEIRKQMVCLLKESNYEYVYVDIKLENILYKCIKGENKGENKVKIFLGDLGSAVSYFPGFFVHTFMPIEYTDIHFFKLDTNYKKEQTLSWMIGIILLSFINSKLAYANLSAKTISKLTQDNFNKVYTMLYNNYGKELASYLNPDPTKRPNIFETLPVINLSFLNTIVPPKLLSPITEINTDPPVLLR